MKTYPKFVGIKDKKPSLRDDFFNEIWYKVKKLLKS